MRVLMITSEWPNGDTGATPFIARQARFLQAAGVEVEVFHFHGAKKPLNYAKAWIQVRNQLRRSRYDLVHAQFGQSGLLALPRRLPLVATFRGSDLLGIVRDSDGRYSRKGKILQWASRMVARRADAVILVSAHLKSYIPASIAAHIIPSGIDFDLFCCMSQEEARRRLGLPPAENLVLFVGNPGQARKRYRLAQQAVDVLNRSLPAQLVLAWKVPHAAVPVYMNACDVLVFTSMQEGSPNVVKEALACNLPVVSVPIGDVPERLQGVLGCELCTDERPEAIAAALERVLRRKQRARGRDAVKNLDEKLLTDRVIGIYHEVLSDAIARKRTC